MANVLTVYPDVGTGNTSCDGWTREASRTDTYATIIGRAGDVGTAATGTPLITNIVVGVAGNANSFKELYRTLMSFDTSDLTADATLVSAKLSVFGVSKRDDMSAADTYNIVAASPASDNAIVAGDYDSLGSVSFGSIAYADFSTTAYNNVTLDANGLGNIDKTGVSTFGAKMGDEIAGTFSGTPGSNHEDDFRYNSSDVAGTVNDPKLVVVYTVTNDPDLEITFGSKEEFSGVSTQQSAVAMLDDTHIVVAYRATGYDGYVRIASIDPDTYNLTWGSETSFYTGTMGSMGIVTIDATHFAIAYEDSADGHKGIAIIGETNGGTGVSGFGTAVEFTSAAILDARIAKLDATHLVASFKDDSDSSHGKAAVCVTDGDRAITSFGSVVEFNAANTWSHSIVGLDSTHFLVVYADGGNSSYGTAIIGVTNGGTTISSYGLENVFNSASTGTPNVTMIDSTHFIVVYRDGGNSNWGTAIIGVTNGGTTISSYGTPSVYNVGSTTETRVVKLTDTNFVMVYHQYATTLQGASRACSTDGNSTIESWGDEEVFHSGTATQIGAAAYSETHFAIAFKNDDDSNYGYAIAGSIPAAVVGPANLKTYNTNPTANIKTINTNLIANVKSLNTNV